MLGQPPPVPVALDTGRDVNGRGPGQSPGYCRYKWGIEQGRASYSDSSSIIDEPVRWLAPLPFLQCDDWKWIAMIFYRLGNHIVTRWSCGTPGVLPRVGQERQTDMEAFGAVLPSTFELPTRVIETIPVDRPAVRTEPLDIAAEPSPGRVSKLFHLRHLHHSG